MVAFVARELHQPIASLEEQYVDEFFAYFDATITLLKTSDEP